MAHIEDRWSRTVDGKKMPSERHGTGSRWKARYRGPDGKERSRVFARKVDAERWLTGREVAKDRGEWTDPALGRVLIGEWADVWMQSKGNLKPSTAETYRVLLRNQVLPTWRDVPLTAVSYADVAAWVAGMRSSGLSASRTRQAYRVLSLMLDHAVKDQRPAIRRRRSISHGCRRAPGVT